MTRIFRAPGRVNLIGEHTDYNGGFVLPAALDVFCEIRADLAGAGSLTARSVNFQTERSWPVAGLLASQPQGDWGDYIAGVAVELARLGIPIPAAHLEVESDVPIGAGLSSSAALEVAAGLALASLAEVPLSKKDLALACQRAENDYVGMKCGIMDQFVSAFGQAGHAILIDCRSLEHEAVPLPDGLDLVMVNSMVHHELSSSAYNGRREECEQAAALLGKRLRDIGLAEWPSLESRLPETLRRRVRHVVTENVRVLAFVDASRRNDRFAIGSLMQESHASMRDDYEITCPEIDYLVEAAVAQPGCIGARMTGGGFGGCTVNLIASGTVESFRENVSKAYESKFNIQPEIYAFQTADGARELT